MAVLGSQFSDISHPIQVVILSGAGATRSEVPAESKSLPWAKPKGPLHLFRWQGSVREFSPCRWFHF